jgi:hypothetical protein
MAMTGTNALVERIWTLFNSSGLSPSQIDRELCLASGTARRMIQWKWHEEE